MKSNLAQEQQHYQAEVVQFPKQERQVMSSDKFDKGYVMSSRLYRYEVRPFLSDAAKNVYAELEDRINGFKDKITDHVSYSQLQGGKLLGSKKMGASTVSKGLKELLELGIISIVSENSRKGNEYQINEVSLVEHFNNKSTTPKLGVLPRQECYHSQDKSVTTPKSGDTIELSRINNRTIHTQENAPEKNDFEEQWNPDLGFLKTILAQTKFSQRADEILSMADFQFHLGNFNAHWENKTHLTENQKTRKFAMWLVQEFEKAERSVKAKTRITEKPSRNVNDAWDSIPQFQGEVTPFEIPEDFV
jgi:hypothetical protein